MSGAPRGKSAPASARIRVTVPGMGATMRLAAATSATFPANGSIHSSLRWPRGVVTSRSRPDQAVDARSGASPRHMSNTPRSRGTNCNRAFVPANSMVNPSRSYHNSVSYCSPPCRKRRRRLRRPMSVQPSVRFQGELSRDEACSCSCCSRIRTATQAAARSSAATAGLVRVSAEISRSMKPVSISPRATSGCVSNVLRNARLVVTPAISNPPSASTIRSSACGRSAPHAISFASSAS